MKNLIRLKRVQREKYGFKLEILRFNQVTFSTKGYKRRIKIQKVCNFLPYDVKVSGIHETFKWVVKF